MMGIHGAILMDAAFRLQWVFGSQGEPSPLQWAENKSRTFLGLLEEAPGDGHDSAEPYSAMPQPHPPSSG